MTNVTLIQLDSLQNPFSLICYAVVSSAADGITNMLKVCLQHCESRQHHQGGLQHPAGAVSRSMATGEDRYTAECDRGWESVVRAQSESGEWAFLSVRMQKKGGSRREWYWWTLPLPYPKPLSSPVTVTLGCLDIHQLFSW